MSEIKELIDFLKKNKDILSGEKSVLTIACQQTGKILPAVKVSENKKVDISKMNLIIKK